MKSFHKWKVKTTSKTGGLYQPYKGMLLASILRCIEKFANRKIFTGCP